VNRTFIILGGIVGALAVAFGAFGTHLLRGHVTSEYMEAWDTAAEYQIIHALAMIASGLLRNYTRSAFLRVSGWLFFIGTVLFSGSLYLLVLGDTPRLGAITPVGGVLLMCGWLSLAISVMKFDTYPKGYHDLKKKHKNHRHESADE
jgi:uncharacterized membrane protein YgdD (TMEM256/DUF423 family)